MNLTNFLKQTDAAAAQYSAEQLAAFIHDIGRVLPEHYREDFLRRLKAIGEKAEKEPDTDAEDGPEFDGMYQQVRNNLKIIDSQEITITGILNEEYDEWYSDSGEEFYYEDSSGISDMLAEACDFVHVCMDTERYKEGFEIGKQLFLMEILCENEYGDTEFSIGELVYHELLQRDLVQVILDTAYCAYHAVPLKKRAETLYGVIVNAGKDEITLEAVMQHGDGELPEFKEFLTLWIHYLGEKTGRDAQRLILEAAGLLNDAHAAMRYAEKYAAVHPELFLNLLENEKYSNAGDRVFIGLEAVRRIPKKYMIRSRVALKTAEYIIEADADLSLLDKCYFAAYESDTSALNYLRVLLNGAGTEEIKEKLRKVFVPLSVRESGSSYSVSERSGFYSEMEENKPDSNMILLLRFLDGQFADVLAKGLNNSKALGWSGTFMKQGIALYLLCSYEGKRGGKGITAMACIVKSAMNFSAEEYRKGICDCNAENDNDLFWELFLKWKSKVPMEPDIRTRAVKKITGLLEKRTEGIMEANRRNYYGECAAYIAALGEVQESLGEAGAKQKLMTSYKDKYSRRSAFRQELRNYGWMDVRKKYK